MRAPALARDQFKTQIIQELFDWWQSFHPGKPRRQDFDILDHASKAPNLFLVKRLPDGLFDYRLHGEEVVRLVGGSFAPRTFSAADDSVSMSRFAKFLTELDAKNIAMHSFGTLAAIGRAHQEFESLDIPLVDESDTPTHFLGIIVGL